MRFIRRLQSLGCAAVLAAGTLTLIVPTTAHAAVACDETALITAINAANAAGGGTVTLASPCTYGLTSAHDTGGAHGPDGLPRITTAITLLGGANSTITRSAADLFRIVEVTSTGGLTLTSVTLSKGDAGLLSGDGGGIYNAGAVTLTNSTLSDNHAGARGGGIYNGPGAATFTGSTVSSNSVGLLNTVGGDGGGIYNNGGAVTFTSGNLSSNNAPGLLGSLGHLLGGRGGGMYDNGGTVTVTSSFVLGNGAGQAGGIVTLNATSFTLTSTAVNNNTAFLLFPPGGVLRTGGTMTVTASPITANFPTNCTGSVPAVPSCVG